MIVSNEQVRNELKKYPFEVENFSKIAIDSFYFCPSLRWVVYDFTNWCKTNPIIFRKQKRDCDNIAEITKVDANKAFQATNTDTECDCAVWIMDVTLVPTSNYFGTIIDFDNRDHVTILIRCNDNQYYIFERPVCSAKKLSDFIDDSIIDRVTHVRL